MSGPPTNQSNPAAAIPVYIASGGGSYPPAPGQNVIGYEQITLNDNTVKTLTPTVGAVSAVIALEAGNVRWKYNVDPTTTSGMPIWGTAQQSFSSAMLAGLRFIRLGGTGTPIMNVTYFG